MVILQQTTKQAQESNFIIAMVLKMTYKPNNQTNL